MEQHQNNWTETTIF